MYELINASNREVSYRILLKQERRRVMRQRSDHDFFVAAEKRRRRLETLGEFLAAFSILGIVLLYSIILPGI